MRSEGELRKELEYKLRCREDEDYEEDWELIDNDIDLLRWVLGEYE